MGHFGFSYVGLIFLMMLFIPNIIWSKRIPEGYTSENENKALVIFERLGEALTSVIVLIFSDFNFRFDSPWVLWLIAAFAVMVMYELWWVRYFKSERKLEDFYGSFLKIPVAGATLPIAAFLLLGIYGRVIWLIAADIILGIGHIGIHLQHKKDITEISK